MRLIQKRGPEPRELVEFRSALGRDAARDHWDDFPAKDVVRDAATKNQGYLCCYCMRRIPERRGDDGVGIKVEHYLPRSVAPHCSLEWNNLLAACTGGEGAAPSQQTCDTRKGNRELFVDPRRLEHVASIRCAANGNLKSDDARVQHDLDDTLNLNVPRLMKAREEALVAMISAAKRRMGDKQWSAEQLRKEPDRLRAAGRLRPYLGVFEGWLEKRARSR